MSVPKAAAIAGIGVETAYRWESSEDVRESIASLAKVYASKLDKSIKLSHDLIDAADKADKIPENAKILDLGAREAQKMREAVGIAPSHAPSVVIGQLVMGDATTVLLPSVQSVLDRALDVTPIPQDTDTDL